MSNEIKRFTSIVKDEFNAIELKENENKGLLLISFVLDSKEKNIDVVQYLEGNKLNIVEVITLLLRDKNELEIQSIFEAVKEFI